MGRLVRPKGGVVNVYLGAAEYEWFLGLPLGKRGGRIRELIRKELKKKK